MFEELGLIGNAVILLVALAILAKASEMTITHALNVASVTGIGKTTIGFVLVTFFTALPELFVAFFSVLDPETVGLSIGNVLGSNIVKICLVLGICFLLVSFKYPRKTSALPKMAQSEMGSLYFGLFIASIVPLTLIYIGHASRFIGIILMGIFVFYMYQLFKTKTPREQALSSAEKQKLRKYLLLTFVGAIGVVACAFFIVDSASYIAGGLGVPTIIIGAIIVGFGTSVPELATSVSAVKRGYLEMALGNIVGSNFLTITCILGVTLIASPLNIDVSVFSNVAIFSLMTNLLLWYFISNDRIGRREGAILLFVYALFLAVSLGVL